MGIVLLSAFLHAGWNYLTKKSQRKIVFIWWSLLASLILFSPMFFIYWPKTHISIEGWYCVVATGVIHALYFWFLGGAYERGDLSLVYPLSRGTGPLLVPILAVLLIHEKISRLGVFGIVVIVLGIYVIHLKAFNLRSFLEPLRAVKGSGSIWALSTGVTIAGYSLVDKVGVGIVFTPVYIYLMFVLAWAMLCPWVLVRERGLILKEWRLNKRAILTVGFLDLFTYMMVLFAMTFSKVSYVVAVREVSIVFSALYGILWLNERHGVQKMAGAVLIALGVIMIGLAR